ncbi:FK506-binding protein 2 like [Verticillium longisporum]|uniref:peptidylprolyl isomerase n=2 Tax=Verticillium TaxID=1036719 RepID=A0A8I2ZJG3_VERLO|nr:FK506-binding protein 2 like [Verticillium longisporum]
MQGALLSFGLLASTAFSFVAADGLKIDKTLEVECERKTVKGDRISVHYRGSLQDGGKEFDASYNRGQPFNVKIGAGQVIKGSVDPRFPYLHPPRWEEGLLDMCIGEKRTLTIPSDMGYGPRGMGPIPGGATLIFETELMGIDGVEKPEKIVVKLPKEEEVKEEVKEKAEEAAEGIAQKVASVVGEAAEAVKTVVADGTDDNQEHNEL